LTMKECPKCQYAMTREIEVLDEEHYCFFFECPHCGEHFYEYPLEN
jgi:hypothetical protein